MTSKTKAYTINGARTVYICCDQGRDTIVIFHQTGANTKKIKNKLSQKMSLQFLLKLKPRINGWFSRLSPASGSGTGLVTESPAKV